MTTTAQAIAQAHTLYCQLTGQKLRLAFDRERSWYEWLCAGFTTQELRQVIAYLQREIRAQRRNVGALKLCNLLQPDRFEEDLNISRVRLSSPPPPRPARMGLASAEEQEMRRRQFLERLQKWRRETGI